MTNMMQITAVMVTWSVQRKRYIHFLLCRRLIQVRSTKQSLIVMPHLPFRFNWYSLLISRIVLLLETFYLPLSHTVQPMKHDFIQTKTKMWTASKKSSWDSLSDHLELKKPFGWEVKHTSPVLFVSSAQRLPGWCRTYTDVRQLPHIC